MMNINWYPGHMARAIREIKNKIKIVDLVIELLDARAPISSRNPIFNNINKERLIILTKSDLADEKMTNQHIKKLEEDKKTKVISLNLLANFNLNLLFNKLDEVMREKNEKKLKRGFKIASYKAIVIGIPNVGKSTFINKITKRKAAPSANTPGFTKAQRWVKTDKIELLDTPGVLWPNLENKKNAISLGLIGTIKNTILPSDEIAKKGFEFLNTYYPSYLNQKYDFKEGDFFLFLAEKRGYYLKDNKLDRDRSIKTFLKEFKDGKIGRITLDR